MDFRSNNELGGREYSSDMQYLIFSLAQKFKDRDPLNRVPGSLPAKHMYKYVKAAGVIIECAMHLSSKTPNSIQEDDFRNWVGVITGFSDLPFPSKLYDENYDIISDPKTKLIE